MQTGRQWIRAIAVAMAWALAAGAAQAADPAAGASGSTEATTAESARHVPFLGGFLTESRILYPLRVDTWASQREHRYEQAEYGASVRYADESAEDRWLDVYFYPVGMVAPQQARAEMEGAMLGIAGLVGQPDAYERVGLGSTRAFRIALAGAPGGGLTAYSGSLDFSGKGKHYNSAIVVLVKDLYYVKARMSMPADEMAPDAVRELLERFMAGLMDNTDFISTGACWTAARNRKPVRVAGCAAPESMTPSVPDDQRELRFEYPPPSERNDGSTPRLRSSRRGLS